MARKNNIGLLVFFAVLTSLLQPAQAAAQGKAVSPMLLLLLFDEGTCELGTETVVWQGLEWQRCEDGLTYNWEEARTYCQELVLKWRSDWRLPTKDELKSLVVCDNDVPTPLQEYPNDPYYCGAATYDTNYTRPTIDPLFQTSSRFYWSSSLYYGDYKWGVFFQRLHRLGALYL